MSLAAMLHTIVDLTVDVELPPVSDLTDAQLLEAQGIITGVRRRADLFAATVAAEIAHRSRPELGSQGLAQTRGARTPDLLISRTTGTSRREARALMNAGELVVPDAVAGRDSGPAWLRGVATALAEGRLSVAAADAIRWGLGEPGPGVSANELCAAAQRLVAEASGCTVEQLSASARAARDELDEAGVAERERTRRNKRYLHLVPRPDGMTRLTGLLDPESAATLTAAIDAVTAPRRGGPRFVEAHDSTWAHTVIADERTVEQMSLDALVDMVRIATLADPGTVFGGRQPAVQVLVSERDLRIGVGLARLEGQGDAVSVGTARRHVCEAGEVGVLFDDAGQAVNVGREQRCFTRRQRLGMAARDGGCRFPGCDRPPSWTEAHHIDEWMKHGGRTDLADGVLVCSHHHLLVHNNGWRFIRRGGEYWVVPPATIDPRQSPIPAPSKSAALRRLQRMTSAGAK